MTKSKQPNQKCVKCGHSNTDGGGFCRESKSPFTNDQEPCICRCKFSHPNHEAALAAAMEIRWVAIERVHRNEGVQTAGEIAAIITKHLENKNDEQ